MLAAVLATCCGMACAITLLAQRNSRVCMSLTLLSICFVSAVWRDAVSACFSMVAGMRSSANSSMRRHVMLCAHAFECGFWYACLQGGMMKLSRPKYRKSRLISVMILVSYPLVLSACTTQLAVYILYLASLPTASYLAAEYLLRARAPLPRSPVLEAAMCYKVAWTRGSVEAWWRPPFEPQPMTRMPRTGLPVQMTDGNILALSE